MFHFVTANWRGDGRVYDIAGGDCPMKKWFSEEHQWVEIDKRGVGKVGITAYAVDELGEVTFVELPAIGAAVTQGEPMCVIESAKAATDVLAPMSGAICDVNRKLDDNPALISASPEQDGWICKIAEIDRSELEVLMTEEQYELFVSDGTTPEVEDEGEED